MLSRLPRKTTSLSVEIQIGLTVFFILLFTYSYFIQNCGNANVVSRVSLALALIEDGTVKINQFHKATIDKAYFEGDYYSDKAPGLTFTALPFIAVARKALHIAGVDSNWLRDDRPTYQFALIVYISTIFTSGILTAVAGLMMYFVALRIGSSVSGAILATLSFGLASPAWGWATAFLGHAMAGSCLFLAFAMIFYLEQRSPDNRGDMFLGFLSGALLSWSVVVEFTAAPAAAVIASFGVVKAIHWERKRLIRVFISAMIGAMILAAPLLVYNSVAFGSPFHVGYENVAGFDGMKQGFFGISYPSLEVSWRILFSSYRGIIWISPILLVVPIAICQLWRLPMFRGEAATVALVAVYYLLFNSGFFYWDGGWSTGPRYITPMLPFLCLPLSVMWTRVNSIGRICLFGLFTLSFILSFICVSADMFSPDTFKNPLFEYLIPKFLRGDIRSLVNLSLRRVTKVQLAGHLSLIPLYTVWAVGAFHVRKRLIASERRV